MENSENCEEIFLNIEELILKNIVIGYLGSN